MNFLLFAYLFAGDGRDVLVYGLIGGIAGAVLLLLFRDAPPALDRAVSRQQAAPAFFQSAGAYGARAENAASRFRDREAHHQTQ